MLNDMKLSTKFAVASLPLLVALVALLVYVTGSGGDGGPSLGAVWFSILGIVTAGVLLALLARSMSDRLKLIADGANDLAETQVPKMVSALQDPRRADLPSMHTLGRGGADEIGDLAASFDAVQNSLHGMAADQLEVMRRGVSEIFVTLARRNSTLVDRQLALLDTLEDGAEDPKLLADYYQLDHLATRMRRNAESLLVLAGAETRRRRSAPVAIDDVVRAGISEIEDYQRVGAVGIAAADVNGPVVGDLSHLLAEIFDNSASFSPPESHVTVGGKLMEGGYLMTVRDRGMGMTAEALVAANQLLASPPSIGLSVEPTLGLTVISLLADKHDVTVEMQAAEIGTIVNIFLPRALFASGNFPESGQPANDNGKIEAFPFGAPPATPKVDGPPLPDVERAMASVLPSLPLPTPAAQPPHPAPAMDPLLADPAEPVVSPAALPARTPGAAVPQFADEDTRSIAAPEDNRLGDALSRLAATVTAPRPVGGHENAPSLLPVRQRGAAAPSTEFEQAAGASKSDPDALRNKLEAFQQLTRKPERGVSATPEPAAQAATQQGGN